MYKTWAVLGLLALAALVAVADDPKPRRTKVTFQQGVDGYAGCVDTELWEVAPTTIMEKEDRMTSDANNGGGESQILLRFEDIIGNGKKQVPPRSKVHSAKMIVGAFDQGNTVNLHRMQVKWDRNATWNALVSGVTPDGLEALRQKEAFTFGNIADARQGVEFEVTDSVQAWVNGAANHGWVFINTGGNGWDFYASEYEEAAARPQLIIEFTPPNR